MYAFVTGVGAAFPARVVGNEHFVDLGLTDRWITTRTGIRQRRWLEPGEKLSDLAVEASAAALADAGRAPHEVDFVVVATMTPDQLSPALATELAARLGTNGPGAVDVNGACSGFLYALDYAVARVEADRSRCILVCGADATSRILGVDPVSAPLFGDGAGAVVVAAGGRRCPAGCRTVVRLWSDGSRADVLRVPRDDAVLQMDGIEVYQLAIAAMADSVRTVCAERGMSVDDIGLLVPHQANARIVRQVAEELGIRDERAALYISESGNTSAASIPTTLARAQREDRLPAGTRVVMAGFGAGVTWGAAAIDWKGCPHMPGAEPAEA